MLLASSRSALALACTALAACGAPKGTPASEPAGATAPQSAVSRFFPLVDGTQWAYDAAEDDTGN
jgi:hypothetical protein